MSESDHDYALVVMLNESESTGDRLTFTVQKVNQADLDPDQTRVAIIENEGVQTKIALPTSLVAPLPEGDEDTTTYLQNVVLQGLESVAKVKPDCIESLEESSNNINIVLQENEEASEVEKSPEHKEEREQVQNNDENEDGKENNTESYIFEDLSVIQSMLSSLKEKGSKEDATYPVEIEGETVPVCIQLSEEADVKNEEDETIEKMMCEEAEPKLTKLFKCGVCDSTYTTKYSLNIRKYTIVASYQKSTHVFVLH